MDASTMEYNVLEDSEREEYQQLNAESNLVKYYQHRRLEKKLRNSYTMRSTKRTRSYITMRIATRCVRGRGRAITERRQIN